MRASALEFPADSAAARGHFPGNPIVPGASLLSETLRAIEREPGLDRIVCGIEAVKFFHPVRPGERVMIEIEDGSAKAISFSCKVAGKTVMTGRASCCKKERAPGGETWTRQPERGSVFAMRLITRVALTAGRRVARLLLYPICGYFYLTSRASRRASGRYLGRVLGRKATARDVFRHIHAFGSTILDRVFLLAGRADMFDIRVHGQEIVDEIVAQGRGALLIGAHFGSFEVIRALSRSSRAPKVRLLMYEDNAQKIASVLAALDPALPADVITLGKVDTMLELAALVEQGGVAGMLADRTIGAEGTLTCNFLGTPARFPAGPFNIAAVLDCPIVLMFGTYCGGNRYEVHFERCALDASRPRRERIAGMVSDYAGRLEDHCRRAPYNWFNFFDFWDED